MSFRVSVALVGDHDPAIVAHRAIPAALRLASEQLGMPISIRWADTDRITNDGYRTDCDAVWCVPGSPYRSTTGALRAIRSAREGGIPFLGTCGGFQHVVLEYARNVLGWTDAAHAETDPEAQRLAIVPLACELVETAGRVCFVPGSKLAAVYGAPDATESYRCRFGVGPQMREALRKEPLRIVATDHAGDARAVELVGHPFFIATLFQPERRALAGAIPPLAVALLQAAAQASGREHRA